jgi:hypothetical protein
MKKETGTLDRYQSKVERVAIQIQCLAGEIHRLAFVNGDKLPEFQTLLVVGLERILCLTDELGAGPWGMDYAGEEHEEATA